MSRKTPWIIVAGVLDTKADEIKFIADQIRASGGEPRTLELSLGTEVGWADISMSELARLAGSTKDEVSSSERFKASDIIVKGAIIKLKRLLEEGKLDGIIAYAGSHGTSMATRIMQQLPVGLPKIMLSTMASGDCRPYVGTRDICMWFPIAEKGLNVVTTKILSVAAGAAVGAATAPAPSIKTKPLIGCTMFGTTTPAVLTATRYLQDKGFDFLTVHAVGSGGKSLEELVRDGYIVGMLDITTHEVGDEITGADLTAGPTRLTAAGDMGIPQVVVPGGVDMSNYGPKEDVIRNKKKSKVTGRTYEEEEKLFRGRTIYQHNPTVTVIGILPEETHAIAKDMIAKLNRAKGPTALLVPMRGWSAYEIAQPKSELGWVGPGPGPFWDGGTPEHPEWSKRAQVFMEVVRSEADWAKPNLDILVCDKHINEEDFALLLARIMEDMLAGKWKKGMYRDYPFVLP